MSRLADTFLKLKNSGRKGFIPFVTAGDPDIETTLEIVLSLADLGADLVELGVPFSDPMADGPTIQRSSARALKNGVTLKDVLHLAEKIRSRTSVPLILFSYMNPVFKLGVDELANASDCIDGVLITDLIDTEAREVSDRLAESGIDLISLVAPTTSDDRLAAVCGSAKGFIYAVSRVGITGVQMDSGSEARGLVGRIRSVTDLPVAVGFGISTAEQVAEAWQYADAAVVGSAIVARIESSPTKADSVKEVEKLVSGLLPTFAKSDGEN